MVKMRRVSMCLIAVVAILLVTSLIFASTIKQAPDNKPCEPTSDSAQTKQADPDQSQPCAEASSAPSVATDKKKPAKNDHLLWVEYVPIDGLHESLSLFTATATVQAELLAAGDVLLENLSGYIRHHLRRPMSCERMDLLAQGACSGSLTPERVRAAMAIAEVSRVIWDLMFEFFCEAYEPCRQVAIDEYTNDIFSDEQRYNSEVVYTRISQVAGIDPEKAADVWCRVVYILRHNLAVIPGIRVKQPEGISSSVAVTG